MNQFDDLLQSTRDKIARLNQLYDHMMNSQSIFDQEDLQFVQEVFERETIKLSQLEEDSLTTNLKKKENALQLRHEFIKNSPVINEIKELQTKFAQKQLMLKKELEDEKAHLYGKYGGK